MVEGSAEENLLVMAEIYDVLVLGGGLAGLGAARELARSGKSVCVVEAQQNPGGRVRTVKMRKSDGGELLAAHRVEAGAQWIHGKENSLYKIAAENGLVSPELGEEACGKFIRADGRVFDEDLVKIVDFKVGQILEECEGFVERPLDRDVSIREYLEEKFSVFLNDTPEIDSVEARELLDWHIRFQVIDNSCWDLRDVGVNAWGRYSFNGESCQAHINVKNGFDQVLEVIVRDVGEQRIYCGHEVTRVDWGNGEISTVYCRNGKSFAGKFIIVTFPIGILKQSGLFVPPLPEEIQSAIDSTGYGTIDKIYLKFEKPFWGGDFKGVQFIWGQSNDDDDEDFKLPNWIKWMTGFDLLPDNVLLGWIGGPGALEMERLTDEEIVRECVQVLGQFLRQMVPLPQQYYCTRWSSNPFERGSYCFNGLCDKDAPRTPLHKPIINSNANNSNPLFLAGEACHPSYFSTAHGAFESGIDQAKEILKLLQ